MPPLSSEEIHIYREQLELYDKTLAVRQDIVETQGVEQDGWVAEDRWGKTKEAHSHIYGASMAAQESEPEIEKEMKSTWPFKP